MRNWQGRAFGIKIDRGDVDRVFGLGCGNQEPGHALDLDAHPGPERQLHPGRILVALEGVRAALDFQRCRSLGAVGRNLEIDLHRPRFFDWIGRALDRSVQSLSVAAQWKAHSRLERSLR